MHTMTTGVLTTLFALAVVVPLDVWVWFDARAHIRRDEPVVLSIGSLTLEDPVHWTVACLVLFVVAFPAYLVCRAER
jgi:hypothetical protein